jgi:Uma2 family endonuclease
MHLDRVFQEAFGEEAVVMVQCPLALSADSEPIADLALLRPPLEAYRERDPGPEDVFLLVEIADTTLVQDRALKLPLYQKAGIPEVWLVNLVEEVLEVYAFPHYAMERHPKGEAVAPRAFPTRPVAWWV